VSIGAGIAIAAIWAFPMVLVLSPKETDLSLPGVSALAFVLTILVAALA
jgi:hypothetical protein